MCYFFLRKIWKESSIVVDTMFREKINFEKKIHIVNDPNVEF